MLSIAIAGDKEAERAKKLMSEHKMKEKPTEGNCNDDEKSTSGLKESNVDELPLACDQSKKEVIELLVQAKCSVNHQDGGFTPIQRAVTLGLPETCELLLEKKADITVLNEKKQNLVHLLASEKSWPGVVYNEVFNSLLQRGIDPFAKDGDGNTYLDLLRPMHWRIKAFNH
ncbi:hypothetical protein AAMO2058_000107900 [Amorphochlora amoebiformis]